MIVDTDIDTGTERMNASGRRVTATERVAARAYLARIEGGDEIAEILGLSDAGAADADLAAAEVEAEEWDALRAMRNAA